MDLFVPVTKLKGIGAKRAESLKKLGITTLEDLLNFYPSKYEDKGKLGFFEQETGYPITVKAKVLKKGSIRPNGYKKTMLFVGVQDEKGNIGEVVFFNQPYLINQLTPGKEFLFFGRIHKKKKIYQIFSPKFASVDKAEEFLSITPIYKKIEGIPQSFIQNSVKDILEQTQIEDPIPLKYREKLGLVSLTQMYRYLHNPKNTAELEQGRRRLKFNEGLKINAGIESSLLGSESTDIILTNFEAVSPFITNLPFDLTVAQKLVLEEIFKDLESGFTMNRMLEGDVGSGKTIIAVISAYLMALNGLQTAYMAPTEILAKQHAQNFKELLEPYGIKTALLTGTQKPDESKKIREELSEGEIQVIIGTHALIQEKTEFYNLGLIITDEQHRFGVKQRGQFGQKGSAHTLVMSATPIPRSLALTLYGDLDLSVIDELPQGRKKVFTYFYTNKKLKNILDFIENEIKKGHQAFIVCPFVEESEEMENVISVAKAYQEVSKYANGRYRIGQLHGKMNTEEKEKTIEAFNNGEIDLLVATSIIEVGINVPNVSVIAILSADRFGLSQLHQLRGRTGRSDIQSYCFLVSDNTNEQTIERMKTIVNCHDGHEIALADLKMRGPGDYFGFNQHGYGNIKLIDPMRDKELFEQSKETVREIFASPKAEDMIAKDYLLKAFNKDTELITMN